MWLFDRKRTRSVADQRGNPSEARPIDAQLAKFEADLVKLERRLTTVEMDWNEWFDKFRRLYARIAKRQSRDEELERSNTDETSRQDDPGATNGFAEVSRHGGPRAPRRNY